ncbi:MAG: hypothetical protein U9Q20_00790 [Campylobacterota bacterium]|nr:hypothetical protein [Campylobacterota bacterium]
MERYEYNKVKKLISDKSLTKTFIAKQLNISRPTLDKWILNVKRDEKFLSENSKGNMVLASLTKSLQKERKQNKKLTAKLDKLKQENLLLKLNNQDYSTNIDDFIEEVYGISEDWKSVYKKGSQYLHPDKGGDAELFRIWKILDNLMKSY